MKNSQDEPRVILIASLSHFILHIMELSFPATSLLIATELIGKEKAYDKIGFAFFIFSLLFGIMQVSGGWLADKLGPRLAIWIYLLGSALSLGLVGLSPNYLMLILALGLAGAFLGIYHPAGMALLSQATKKHGASMGIHGVGGNLGLALSPFLASALAGALGWRKAYFALALIPLLFSFWVLFDRKLELKFEPDPQDNNRSANRNSFLSFPIIILFLMSLLSGLCYRGFTTFLPLYFNEKISENLIPGFSSLLQAGAFTTAVLVLGMFGQFFAGKLADRYSREKLLTAVFILSSPFLFALSFLSGIFLVLSAMTFAFFYFSNQPVSNALLPQYTDRKIIGRLYGWFYFMNFGAGSIMSWIAGEIGQKISLQYIFILIALIILLAGVLGFFLIRNQKPAGS